MLKTAGGILLMALLALAAGCSRDNSVTGDDSSGAYKISGMVLYESGSAIKDVYVEISGTTTRRGFEERISPYSVPSDGRGAYIFTRIGNGSYTITPFKSDFTFNPASRSVIVNGVNMSVWSFTGIPKPYTSSFGKGEYTINGRITDSYGAGIGGISVGLADSDLKMTAVTNPDGYFSFNKVPNDSYRIAPGKEGYTFSPPFTTAVVMGGDVTLNTFTSSTEGNFGGDTSFAGTHLYYPMSRDASWTIMRSVVDFINEYTASYTLTLTVTGTKMIGADRYWVVVNDNDKTKSYIRIMNDTVYKFADFATVISSSKPSTGFDAGFHEAFTHPGPMKNAGAFMDPSPYTDPLPYIRLDAMPATIYDIMRYSEWIYSVGNSFETWIGTYHGTETVTVTAGTFADCRKYEILYDTLVSGGYKQHRITTTILWLAPNVGIVKLNETKTDSNITIYTREEELIGYSVP